MACLVFLGCGKKAQQPAVKKPEPPQPARTINVNAGDFTKRQEDQGRKVLWTVKWLSGNLSFDGENSMTGNLTKVSGVLYSDGKPESSYVADYAHADKQSELLELKGHVVVTRLESKVTLSCNSLTYSSSKNKIVAKGDVGALAPGYEFGTLPELWATADLTQIATPDLYQP